MIILENKNLSFSNRLVIKTGFWFSILIALGLIIAIANNTPLNHWFIWLIVIALLLNDLRKSILKSKDYITKIDLTDKTMTIYYNHLNKENVKHLLIIDSAVHTDSKQLSMDKYMTTRLNFKLKNLLILRQYKIGDWSVDKMTKIESLILEKQNVDN